MHRETLQSINLNPFDNQTIQARSPTFSAQTKYKIEVPWFPRSPCWSPLSPNLKRNPFEVKSSCLIQALLSKQSGNFPCIQFPGTEIGARTPFARGCIFPEIIATKKILQPHENSGLSACHGPFLPPSFSPFFKTCKGQQSLCDNFLYLITLCLNSITDEAFKNSDFKQLKSAWRSIH